MSVKFFNFYAKHGYAGINRGQEEVCITHCHMEMIHLDLKS